MTNYADNWKRHYRKSKIRLFDLNPNSKNDEALTPNQFHLLIKKRGYSINLTCNECDELATDKDGNIFRYCKKCGNKFTKVKQ